MEAVVHLLVVSFGFLCAVTLGSTSTGINMDGGGWGGLYEGTNVTDTLNALRSAEGVDYHMAKLDANADSILLREEISDAISRSEEQSNGVPFPDELIGIHWRRAGTHGLDKRWSPEYRQRLLLGELKKETKPDQNWPKTRKDLSQFLVKARNTHADTQNHTRTTDLATLPQALQPH